MLKLLPLFRCSKAVVIDFHKIILPRRQFSSTLTSAFNKYHNFNSLLLSKSQYTSKIMESKRIAVCQMTATGDKERNLNAVTKLVEEAACSNAQMVFFPEACDYLCDNKKDMLSFAEPLLTGATVEKYRNLAKQHNVWLSMGGLHEKDPENDNKVFNTHIIINNQGEIVQTYRKLHMFDVEIPEKNIRLKESDFATPGQHIVMPVNTPVGSVGMAICYDMRFPELAVQLTALGADILTFPSAFTYATGKVHWEILLRCRAIENQCFVVAAAQIGSHNAKRKSYGHAMCVNPWGDIIATCGNKEDEPCLAIADLDYNKFSSVRRDMPVQQHRRADVYKIMAPSIRVDILKEHSTSAITESNTANGNVTNSETKNVEEEEEGEYLLFNEIKIGASTIFFQTDLTFAFVNIRCVVPGHVLVAPKRIAKRTYDLTPEEIADFFQVVIRVQKVMEQVHNATSSTVTVQDGPEAGQTVQHVHCHIMPRKKGDFKDVDMIYLELAKHDAKPLGSLVSKPPRSVEERRAEAAMLKSFFT